MKGKQVLKVGVAICSVGLLSGCITVQRSMETQVAEIPPEKRAYVVGSFTVACEASGSECHTAFSIMHAFYKGVGGEPVFGELQYVTGAGHKRDNSVLDYVRPVDGEKGLYFCLTVVPGNYSFYNYRFWRYAGGEHSFSLRDENEFDVPFKALEGEVVYIGDVKLTVATGRNMFGIKMPIPGVVELSPGVAEDRRLAQAKCPENARSLPIRNSPLMVPIGGHPALVGRTEN